MERGLSSPRPVQRSHTNTPLHVKSHKKRGQECPLSIFSLSLDDYKAIALGRPYCPRSSVL
jgi:hypothetical protein